jgi:general secretion pathway protein I
LVDSQSSESGFTVIEVLVALTVLAMSTAVLLAVFSQGLDRARSNEVKIAARNFAQSLLARAEAAPPAELANSSGRSGGMSWNVQLQSYGSPDDRNAWQFSPVTVTATVHWLDHGRTHSISLTTLRLAPRKTDS